MSDPLYPDRLRRLHRGPFPMTCRYGYLNHDWLMSRDRRQRLVWCCRRCHQDVQPVGKIPHVFAVTDHRGEP